ncbi:hypothetical protein CANINC_004051 [Pichia inconspicua]|uniref:Uncharacterized protein n=1 Tax=Pichia inconspicua TaxID=52247 RepID=A0A4T0WWZ8_9ASCO|nr:hypothetical protein CANINC_004051 [[Candida] inconspicua]
MNVLLPRAKLPKYPSIDTCAYLTTGEIAFLVSDGVIVFLPTKKETIYEFNKISTDELRSLIEFDDWIIALDFKGKCGLWDIIDGGFEKIDDIETGFGFVECGHWNQGSEIILCGKGCERYTIDNGCVILVDSIDLKLNENEQEKILYCVGENDIYVCVTSLNRIIKFNNDGILEEVNYNREEDDTIVNLVYKDDEIGVIFRDSVFWKGKKYTDCGNTCLFEIAEVVSDEIVCFNSFGERFSTNPDNEGVEQVFKALEGSTVYTFKMDPSGVAAFALHAPGVSTTSSLTNSRGLSMVAIPITLGTSSISFEPTIAASRRDSLLRLHKQPPQGPDKPYLNESDEDSASPYEVCPVTGRTLDRPSEIAVCVWCRTRVFVGDGSSRKCVHGRCAFCGSRLGS